MKIFGKSNKTKKDWEPNIKVWNLSFLLFCYSVILVMCKIQRMASLLCVRESPVWKAMWEWKRKKKLDKLSKRKSEKKSGFSFVHHKHESHDRLNDIEKEKGRKSKNMCKFEQAVKDSHRIKILFFFYFVSLMAFMEE